MAQELCHAAGGVTVTSGEGQWIASDGSVAHDPVALVSASVTDADWPGVESILPHIAADIAESLAQESVAVETDGVLHLVPGDQSANPANSNSREESSP